MGRVLTILEVSQKQAYIFKSNKIKDNIINSEVIAYALSDEYISKVLEGKGYNSEDNMVYSGGGHTILEFSDFESARNAVSIITENVYKDFDGLQVFAKNVLYDEKMSVKDNLQNLTAELERKKSIRKSMFHQGRYGIEKININTDDIKEISKKSEAKEIVKGRAIGRYENNKYYPEGYSIVEKFEELGGDKGESNFIAVVHIDGNGMGKRVENLYNKLGNCTWEEMKKHLKDFSEAIDKDFKQSFKKMNERVRNSLENGTLKGKLKLKDKNFPIRRIITAGDDICFVTEGRIGIECSRIFIEELCEKINSVDNEGYSACAGVAIVHTKYPFYRAYDIAEMLCSNAKRFGATISPEDNGSSISSIDWHIDFGEMKDTLKQLRADYNTADGNRLEMRPYIINASEEIQKQYKYNRYESFYRSIMLINKGESEIGVGKIKEFRNALKSGETASGNYIKFNRISSLIDDVTAKQKDGADYNYSKLFTGEDTNYSPFIEIKYGNKEAQKHSTLFDAIELMDTFLPVKEVL
ncbi:MAG: hypothetical protein K6G11_05340 [Lachnospiraceae bacterium]|nr:hypothetical protein [Lachnospiraceae bacterium]